MFSFLDMSRKMKRKYKSLNIKDFNNELCCFRSIVLFLILNKIPSRRTAVKCCRMVFHPHFAKIKIKNRTRALSNKMYRFYHMISSFGGYTFDPRLTSVVFANYNNDAFCILCNSFRNFWYSVLGVLTCFSGILL